MAALLHKAARQDATAVGYQDVLRMGTSSAADILRLPTGRLEKGRLADFIGIDLQHVSLTPSTPETLMANVVYAMQPEAIDQVVVGGRPVIRNRRLLSVRWETLQTRVSHLVSSWD